MSGCAFATNGGFFDTQTGACLGNVVSEGAVLEKDDAWTHPTFAIDQVCVPRSLFSCSSATSG